MVFAGFLKRIHVADIVITNRPFSRVKGRTIRERNRMEELSTLFSYRPVYDLCPERRPRDFILTSISSHIYNLDIR